MSSIAVSSNPTGTGVFTITSPATNTNRTLTLPDDSGTLVHSGNTLFNATVALTGAYTVVAADRGKLFDCTGTFTITLTAAATLGTGFSFAVRNSGTGVITLDPNAAELVDGVATITYAAGVSSLVTCNGTAFKTVGLAIVQKILQVVHVQNGVMATGTTLIPRDNTIPQQTEGDQYMSLAITPIAATSRLRIDVTAWGAHSATSDLTLALFRDAVADSIGVVSTYFAANYHNTKSMTVVVNATSTAATTFKLRMGGNAAGTTTFSGEQATAHFGGTAASTMTITEIAA